MFHDSITFSLTKHGEVDIGLMRENNGQMDIDYKGGLFLPTHKWRGYRH